MLAVKNELPYKYMVKFERSLEDVSGVDEEALERGDNLKTQISTMILELVNLKDVGHLDLDRFSLEPEEGARLLFIPSHEVEVGVQEIIKGSPGTRAYGSEWVNTFGLTTLKTPLLVEEIGVARNQNSGELTAYIKGEPFWDNNFGRDNVGNISRRFYLDFYVDLQQHALALYPEQD